MWYEQNGKETDVCLSTRIRLARNIEGFPFPGKMSAHHANTVIDKTKSVLSGQKLDFINISEAETVYKMMLLEDHTISPELISSTLPCGVFVGDDVSIMVCEEDHLRLQCILSGYDLETAYAKISEIDDILEKNLPYAFSEKYGYLTKCPTNVGTGMRASVMLHLPALTISGNIDNIIAAAQKLGCVVRGMYGEGSSAGANIYQVSGQVSLGISEKETLEKLKDVVDMIIEKERHICDTLLKSNPTLFKDKVSRAFGTMKSAYTMSSDEFMSLVPYVKMGINTKVLKNISVQDLTRLIITMQPAHITNLIKEDNIKKRDEERARLLREFLAEKR